MSFHAQKRTPSITTACTTRPAIFQPDTPDIRPCLRSQHLIILLAEWMSAVALQAIFYGKSQTSIQEKVIVNVAKSKGSEGESKRQRARG